MLDRSKLVILVALAALHFALALAFASMTPWRTGGVVLISRSPAPDIGAPDERQHVNYIAQLATGGGLPVFRLDDPQRGEHYESHQPPAYYAYAAAYSRLLGVADPASASAGMIVRSANAWIGAATVIGTFFAVWWGLRQTLAGLFAAAIVALLPMNVALSGAASNDPLLLAFATWALAFLALALREGWTTRRCLAIGVLTGLAILTKTTGVALLPVLFVALFVARDNRPKATQIAATAVPMLLLVLPWWARNQSLYGDPLAIKIFSEAFTGNPQAGPMIAQLGAKTYWIDLVAWWTLRSFVGVFGYMDIWLTSTGLPSGDNGLYSVVLLTLTAGIVAWFFAWKGLATRERAIQVLFALYIGVVAVLFLRFNTQYFQAQGRYLLPAIAPIAVGVAIGWLKIAGARAKVAISLVVGLLVITNLLALTRLPAEFSRRTAPPSTSPG